MSTNAPERVNRCSFIQHKIK